MALSTFCFAVSVKLERLFHPQHIVIAVEFKARFVKDPDLRKPEFAVQRDRCVIWHGYTGEGPVDVRARETVK